MTDEQRSQPGRIGREDDRVVPRRSLWTLLVLFVVSCGAPMVRPAPFRLRPDTVRPGDLRGPFDGRVIDAETGRPVAGASVHASWAFVEGYGLNAPGAWHEHTAITTATGHYAIPRLGGLPRGGSQRLSDFHLVIYKRGYVAYRSDRRFEDFGPRTDFTQLGHEVRLERWRSDISHVRHLRYVGGGPTLAALTRWEIADASAELSGRPTVGPDGGDGGDGGDLPVLADNLDAALFLLPEDVKQVTGFQGQFEIADLGDDPPSPEYDSVHLRAKGLDEGYDVAARVWKLEPGEAQAHYGRLLKELPGVKEVNEVGDRSLRASQGDILGVGFLDARRGYVVLIQCGASQCSSHEKVAAIAKRIRERIEQFVQAGATGGGTP